MTIERARKLRSDQTDAEAKFWNEARNRQIANLKFKRQMPIDRYIVDFVCEEEKLIVELDGSQHAEQQDYDERRTKVLEQHGYRVIRFWNNDVLKNMDGVYLEIMEMVGDG